MPFEQIAIDSVNSAVSQILVSVRFHYSKEAKIFEQFSKEFSKRFLKNSKCGKIY